MCFRREFNDGGMVSVKKNGVKMKPGIREWCVEEIWYLRIVRG